MAFLAASMRKIFCIFLFISSIFQSSFSQSLNFSSLTVNDGLSQNAVLSVVQDGNGFMWFGTQDGLNRYDAKSFKVYKHSAPDSTSLSFNYISILFVDSQKKLWVGTRNGLNRYSARYDRFEHIALATNSKSDIIISSICEDSRHQLWVWSSVGLFMLSEPKRGQYFSRLVPLPDSVAGLGGTNSRIITQDRNGNYWLGSSAGLTRMTMINNKPVLKTFKKSPDDKHSLSDNYITSIFQDSKGRLWIGTLHGGINLYDSLTDKFIRYSFRDAAFLPVNNNIRVITENNDGKILIGTLGGLCILDPETKSWSLCRHSPDDNHSLSNNSIYSVYPTKDNIIWIGTYWGGVNYSSPYNSAFHIYRTNKVSDVNNNIISVVKEDVAHNLWIGTEGGGLNYLNIRTGTVTAYVNKPNDPGSIASDLIKVVYIDKENTVWIGTHGGGLNKFEGSRFSHYLYGKNDPATLNSEIISLYEDDNERLWTGTQNGLLILDKNNDLLPIQNKITSAIGRNTVKSIYETSGKKMLLGTSQGLFITDDSDNVLAHLDKRTGLPGNDINCIYEDEHKNIWLGFYNGGICCLYLNGHTIRKVLAFDEKDGLSNNNVMSIQSDDEHNLWFSTGNGLSKFDPVNKSFSNYFVKDGIAGNTFNINASCKTYEGELLFGGYNGITRFFPQDIIRNNHPPRTIFTGLDLFNRQVSINGKDGILKKNIDLQPTLVFHANQNIFTVDFATLNYIMPEKNRYAYKLDGFNKDWTYTNTPSATYMNLPPGTYTLQVKGTNNDQIWGEPVSIKIKVLPHFWETAWAYLIYMLAFSTLLFFIIRFFFLRSLLKRDQELTALKLNFFTNISHEIRTHLSLINGPVEQLLSTTNDEFNAHQLKTVKKNADSLLQLVTELMDFRKAETGSLKLHFKRYDIVSFLREEIMEPFYNLSLSKNIRSELISDVHSVYVDFDKEQLHKVFFNLLHNAYKFTESGCYVNVTVNNEKDNVQIIISDNGSGIAPENIPNIFTNYFQGADNGQSNSGYGIGLALAKSIVELHKGAISVENNLSNDADNITSFIVTLPKTQEPTTHEIPADNINMPVKDYTQYIPQEMSLKPETAAEREHKHTILIVEDNTELRTFIRNSLSHNYNVYETANGEEGLNVALKLIPDIVVSDIMMPVMDGIKLCSEIKNNEATSHIPVILLTAKSTTGDYVTGLKTGADIYLTKPFSTHVLLLHIGNLLALRKKTHEWFKKQYISLGTPAPEEKIAPAQQEDEFRLPRFADDEFLNRLIDIIEEEIDNPELSVSFLSKKAAMSPPILYKKIFAVTELTVNDFIKAVRLRKAAMLLQSKKYNVSETAYMTGFSDRRYFTKEFKKMFGVQPSGLIQSTDKGGNVDK